MAGENRMPPELLEHYKSKSNEAGKDSSGREEEKTAKERRKEAVTKARVRLESKNRRGSDDEEKETREGRYQESRGSHAR